MGQSHLRQSAGRGERLVNRLVQRQHDDPLRLGLHNLYILPTRFGLLWLCAAALLLIVAIQTQQNGPLMLADLMVGLMLLALHLTHFNLQGLELACAKSGAAFAGRPAGYALTLRSRVARDGVQLAWQAGGQGGGVSVSVAACEQLILLPWIPTRRGWQRPGRLRLHSSAPLGLFHCWSLWDPPRPQLIYPRRQRGPVDWRPASPASRNQDGITPQQSEGDGEWRDLRPHRPEDGPRRLAWKHLAQGRGELSKQFSPGTGEPLLLAPAPGVPREQALEHLCEQIWQLSRSGAYFGLLLPGSRISPGCGETHRDRCLEAIATAP